MSATRELLGEFDEGVELGARRAALDQLERLVDPVLKTGSPAAHIDRGAGVERHDIARRARAVLQCRQDDLARFLYRGYPQRTGVVHRQTEPLGIDRKSVV